MTKKGHDIKLPILRDHLFELQGSMSAEEFANKIGISAQTVGFWLRGERIPSAENLMVIAEKCNCSVDWLLGLCVDRTPILDIRAMCEMTGLTSKTVEYFSILNGSTSQSNHDTIAFINRISENEMDSSQIADSPNEECPNIFSLMEEYVKANPDDTRIELGYHSVLTQTVLRSVVFDAIRDELDILKDDECDKREMLTESSLDAIYMAEEVSKNIRERFRLILSEQDNASKESLKVVFTKEVKENGNNTAETE